MTSLQAAEHADIREAVYLKHQLDDILSATQRNEAKLKRILSRTSDKCLRCVVDTKIVTLSLNTGERVQVHISDIDVIVLPATLPNLPKIPCPVPGFE